MFVFNYDSIILVATATEGKAVADAKDAFFIESEADLNDLTGPQKVTLFNILITKKVVKDALGDKVPAEVKRFPDSETANRRVWALAKLIEAKAAPATKPETVKEVAAALTETVMSAPSQEALAKAIKAPKEAKPRKLRGVNLAPAEKLATCRVGSVQALLVDTLAKGATFEQLRTAQHEYATANGKKLWQDVTLRSGLNWDVNHLKGYGHNTHLATGVMTLTYPAGVTKPLAHRPRAEAKAKAKTTEA